MVEMALVLPVLLLLVIGGIDLDLMVSAKSALNYVASETARCMTQECGLPFKHRANPGRESWSQCLQDYGKFCSVHALPRFDGLSSAKSSVHCDSDRKLRVVTHLTLPPRRNSKPVSPLLSNSHS